MKQTNYSNTAKAIFLTLGLMGTATQANAIIFGDDPFPEPEIPESSPPSAPTPTIYSRQDNRLYVKFTDNNDDENGYYLQRRIGNGSWVTVVSTGALSNSTYYFFDNGRTPDTYHCYRVRAYNQSGTTTSSSRCAYTKDGNDHEVWRAQLEVTTSGISNADTDNSVYVRLNTSSGIVQPNGNRTWVDYGRNDFERNDTFIYDLDIKKISELGDINQIFIGKTGSDGWCIEDISLKVNNFEVFNKNYTSEPSGCRWLDNDNGHVNYVAVNHSQLRAHNKWSNYNEDAALLLLAVQGIDNDEITSRIESMVGDQIHYEDLYWGHIYGAPVEVTYGCPTGTQNCSTIHVDLDLAADVNNLPDPSVDIDFDVDFQCANGQLSITTSNFTSSVNYSWIYDLFSLGLVNLLEGEIENRIEDAWQQIAQDINGVPDCNVFVTTAGDIVLEAAQN